MRTAYKYTVLIASIAAYYLVAGEAALMLVVLAAVVYLSSIRISKLVVALNVIMQGMGFIALKYVFADKGVGLPIGYSVFAFSAIAYLVDTLKSGKKNNILNVFCFLFFFPKMLAGPLIRYDFFVKQIDNSRMPSKEQAYTAFKIIIHASFCKFVVADVLCHFGADGNGSGINLLMQVLLFAIEIYMDFLAYSNYAIAFAMLLGISLPVNFNRPYAASSFREFWRRWNITLSEWLRDYVYIPLGGNRGKRKIGKDVNTMITFLVSAVWHGATIPFLFWGLAHGSLVCLERRFINKLISPVLKRIYAVAVFVIAAFLWQAFRLKDTVAITDFLMCLTTSAPISLALVKVTAVTFLLMYALDSQKMTAIVFTTEQGRGFIVREVALMCAMICVMILFTSNPSLNFFYFRF